VCLIYSPYLFTGIAEKWRGFSSSDFLEAEESLDLEHILEYIGFNERLTLLVEGNKFIVGLYILSAYRVALGNLLLSFLVLFEFSNDLSLRCFV